MGWQQPNDQVTVAGKRYRVIKTEGMGHLGTKFSGKARFVLVDEHGAQFSAFGRRVAHNSKLRPVD